jgi:two-component system aerobic respiration control sensor histidine kinase ArcB
VLKMSNDQKKVLSSLKKIDVMEILNLIPEHIYWKDKNGIYLGCNQSQARDLGLNSCADIVGKTDYDLLPQKEAEELRKNDLMIMENGIPTTIEEDDYISTKMPLRDEDNNIIGILGVSINFKSYKDRTDNTHHMLDEIIAAMPGHVYWKDRNCILLGCNEQQAIDVGLRSRHEIVGKSAYDIISKNLPENIKREHAALIDKADKAIMESGVAKIFEEFAVELDGREATYLSQKTPLHDNKSEVIGLLGISVDITELKEAKELAQAANKAKTEFVQNMQHDIATPLASIMILLHTLKDRKMEEEVREVFVLLEKVCQQLRGLCRNFSAASLDETGEEPLKKQALNIREITKDSINIHRPTAENKNIALNMDISADVPTNITSDEFRLRCIFLNLLGNAIKFTDEGKVTLSICMNKNNNGEVFLCVKVRDTGIGINKDKLPLVFDKYVRDNTGDSEKYPGTGLGLYFVKKYVEDLGGTLRVESELSKGSVFSVDIPKSMCM